MADLIPFSIALRERSSSSHSDSESAGFMSDLMSGNSSQADYTALVAQHYFIYRALEAATENMRHNPEAAPFISDKLTRLPALEADLEYLLGESWEEQIEPLPTTKRYVDRIEAVGKTWPGGFVAHHYTRYLGDLSGGIFIGRVMAKRFGFDTNGIGFYLFADIADPRAFKDAYREQLDQVPWDDKEREAVIEEVLAAYRFNTELFADLQAARNAA